MLKTYEECISECGSDYYLKKNIQNGKIYKIEKGIYSDEKSPSELSVIMFKYPQGVISMETAFFYHGLTDTIPEEYVLSTERNATKIKDSRVKQIFSQKLLQDIGKMTMNYQGTDIQIYDKERMLIELIRNREKIPYDYYKEIIRNYRDRLYDLDIEKLQEDVMLFPRNKIINEVITKEVF